MKLMKLNMLNREYIYCRIFKVKSDETRLINNILLKHTTVFLHLDSTFYGRILEGFAPPPLTHTHARYALGQFY